MILLKQVEDIKTQGHILGCKGKAHIYGAPAKPAQVFCVEGIGFKRNIVYILTKWLYSMYLIISKLALGRGFDPHLEHNPIVLL